MAYREVHGVEIREIIRRWQAGLSQRRIASGTGLSRVTVRRYVEAAEAAGLTPGGPEPSEEQLAALATLSLSGPRQVEAPSEELLSPWAEQIERWLETDRLQLTRIQELLAGRGCEVSYTTLRRFIRRRGWRHRLPSTVRMDDGPPGEVAEMDFGRLGFIRDPESGRRRTVWALVVVWRYSRHCFVWPTTSQKLDAVVEGLEEAWAFFGGVPRYLVVDNFPAAVAGADALHPRLTRGFLEYARHRGFITDPARVRHLRDKPRVERSIPYVRERLFKGGDFRDVVDLRSAARSWCLEVAGQRIHGTTRRRPLEVFLKEELPLLAPWDGEPYEVPDWRTATVHPDHHIACQYALYSVPSMACPPGQKVEVQLCRRSAIPSVANGAANLSVPSQRAGGDSANDMRVGPLLRGDASPPSTGSRGGPGEWLRRAERGETAALMRALAGMTGARVVLEVGPRSPWLSRMLAELGHDVIVANPRRVRLIARSQRKTDRSDAEHLTRLGRFDPALLFPIRHRSATAQADLQVLRSREALVRARTMFINHVRGAVRAWGAALPSCTAPAFHRAVREDVPEELGPALLRRVLRRSGRWRRRALGRRCPHRPAVEEGESGPCPPPDRIVGPYQLRRVRD